MESNWIRSGGRSVDSFRGVLSSGSCWVQTVSISDPDDASRILKATKIGQMEREAEALFLPLGAEI